MSLESLSLKELVLLSLRAERQCVRCFSLLVERVTPRNETLLRALREHVAEEIAHEEALARFDAQVPHPLVLHLDEEAISRVLRDHLPALWRNGDAAEIDPATALAWSRAIEEDATRFYRTLSGLAPDEPSRRLFRSLAEREASHGRSLPDGT